MERFPKHCTVDVTVNGAVSEAFAWGLELIEGRDWKFLFVPCLVVIILSIVFGVAWACLKNDVSGGFAVSGTTLTLLTCFIGAVEVAWDNS